LQGNQAAIPVSARLSSGGVPARSTIAWQPGSCTGNAKRLNGFLEVMECEAGDCTRHADAFDRIRAGRLQALIVHGVYEPQQLVAVVDRLERHDPAFLQTWFPEKFRAWFYGRNLNLSGPDLAGYFAEAARFHAQLAELLPPPHDLLQRVGSLLAALDHGRPFQAAPGPHPGERYMFTTLRAHAEGGYIPPHFDNEQILRPAYRHLQDVVERHMTSFVLAFTRADGGGALEVFDLRMEPDEARLISDDRASARPDVSQLDSVAFRLPPGAMIILDSGRYLHRVTPVQGARKRWSACSFMSLSRQHDATYCWG
jgi:hypothetical protein